MFRSAGSNLILSAALAMLVSPATAEQVAPSFLTPSTFLSVGRIGNPTAQGDDPPAQIANPSALQGSDSQSDLHEPDVPSAPAADLLHNISDFPALPPDPDETPADALPPQEQELWRHGGSYLYQPEGDRLNWPPPDAPDQYQVLRVPETYRAPQPFTLFQEFLGADPIAFHPQLKWFGAEGYHWEPRVVVYGGYQVFGIALESGGLRQDLIGHQLLLDVDFRLTGTERMHVQFRPVGEKNTGGSYYQFSDPDGWVDNSTGIPDRWWFEGELDSVFGGWFPGEFKPRDWHFVVGKFPFALHNFLLMNDDITGVVINKNTKYLGTLSNLNVQFFYAVEQDNSFAGVDGELFGVHASADYRHVFIESTYAQLSGTLPDRDAYWAALSATKLLGPFTLAGRALFQWGDEAGTGAGQLFVLEANRTRIYDHKRLGVERAVYYATAFRSTEGWNSIAGGNFDRLRIAFSLDPTITIAAGASPADNAGVALGVQLFRRHEDESITPEFAFETPDGESVYGVGLRYQRKTGKRSFFEIRGVGNWSDNPRFRREGVFVSETIRF